MLNKNIQVDGSRKFILVKLQVFYKKWSIIIKYAISYIHEENVLTKWEWQIIVIIKDLILIDNNLLDWFWVKIIETTYYLQNLLLTKT